MVLLRLLSLLLLEWALIGSCSKTKGNEKQPFTNVATQLPDTCMTELPERDGQDERKGLRKAKGDPGEWSKGMEECPGTLGPPGPQGPPGIKGMKGEPGEIRSSLIKELLTTTADLRIRLQKLTKAINMQEKIIQVGEKIFATGGQIYPFLTINKTCHQMGGVIATPMNEEENAAILKLVVYYNTYAYLGLKEGNIPGNFYYLDGTPVKYTNWYAGCPDGKGSEDCVEMYTDGTWNDKNCYKNRLAVCEF